MSVNIKDGLRQSYNNHACDREKNEMQEWKRQPRQKFLERIKEENKKTLLEIGAGTGRDSRFFLDNKLQVTAADLSAEMVKLCREKGINAYELDFFEIAQLNKKFDAIWAMNCLLHVEKAKLGIVLQGINNVLEPSGLFFMGVYGGEDKEGIWEEDFYTPKRFFSFFTDANIEKVVEDYFDIISFDTIRTEGKYDFQSIIMRKK
jgi:cyclopropane fatty-acyl-phospholipid synthase-like methyltransferase